MDVHKQECRLQLWLVKRNASPLKPATARWDSNPWLRLSGLNNHCSLTEWTHVTQVASEPKRKMPAMTWWSTGLASEPLWLSCRASVCLLPLLKLLNGAVHQGGGLRTRSRHLIISPGTQTRFLFRGTWGWNICMLYINISDRACRQSTLGPPVAYSSRWAAADPTARYRKSQ